MDSLSDEDAALTASSWEPHRNAAGTVEISVNFFHENGRMTFECVGIDKYLVLYEKGALKWQLMGEPRPEHNPTPQMVADYLHSRAEASRLEEQRQRAEDEARWQEREQARLQARTQREAAVVPAPAPTPAPEAAAPDRVYAAVAPVSTPVYHRPASNWKQAGRQRMDRGTKLQILRDLAAQLKAKRTHINVGILARVATDRGGPLEGKTQETSLNTFLYTLKPEEKTFVGL